MELHNLAATELIDVFISSHIYDPDEGRHYRLYVKAKDAATAAFLAGTPEHFTWNMVNIHDKATDWEHILTYCVAARNSPGTVICDIYPQPFAYLPWGSKTVNGELGKLEFEITENGDEARICKDCGKPIPNDAIRMMWEPKGESRLYYCASCAIKVMEEGARRHLQAHFNAKSCRAYLHRHLFHEQDQKDL